jgi:hypothetical protein
MSRPRKLHLFVLIDALGWRFLEGNSFLTDLLPCRTPLRTVLGFSSGAIPTILTGVPPAQNGHWNLFYYDPQGSPFRWLRYFRFLPESVLNNRVSRKLLKEMGRRMLGLGSQFECCVQPTLLPFFNYVEKRSIYDREGISGASSIFDQLAERGVPYRVYSYHHSTDREILRQAKQDLETTDVNFFFVYLSELDMFLHTHCNDADRLREKLAWYEQELRGLFACARKMDPEARLTVFSDHGMTPVRHHFDLMGAVEKLAYKMPDDYLVVYDSTMARFWFFNEQARQDILNTLGTLSCGRIVPDSELQQLGVFFADRRYGEVIFLMNPGWLLARSDFNGRGWMPAGMHGYHPEDSYSDGIFLSNQPLPAVAPSVADVYQCMHGAMLQEVR